MARTKQTARKSCFQPHSARAFKGPARSRGSSAHSMASHHMAGFGFPPSAPLPQANELQQFSVKFDDQDQSELKHVRTAIFRCKECQAVLTKQSRLMTNAEHQKAVKGIAMLSKNNRVWVCEFCRHSNIIPANVEIPTDENPCFLVEEKIGGEGGKRKKEQKVDKRAKTVVFCIDVSGSMREMENGVQKIEAIKQALVDEVSRMKANKENVSVGIILFGSRLNVLSEKGQFELTDKGDFNDWDKLVQLTKPIGDFTLPVQTKAAALIKIIQGIDIEGCTALGPALVVSLELAGRYGNGSQILFCTDGMANQGIGSAGMFSFSAPLGMVHNQALIAKFYEDAGQQARKKGIQVSVLSLVGDNCNLKNLFRVNMLSGGSLLKINTKHVGTEFGKIVKDDVLGTNASILVRVNNAFTLNPNMGCNISPTKNVLLEQFGSFTRSTEKTYSFNTVSKAEAEAGKKVNLELYEQKQLPMQIEVSYTSTDGNKYLQVVTDWREITTDMTSLFEGANFGLFAASCLQNASKKIKDNLYDEAEKEIDRFLKVTKEKFEKVTDKKNVEGFKKKFKELSDVLKSKVEKSKGVRQVRWDAPTAPKLAPRSRSKNRKTIVEVKKTRKSTVRPSTRTTSVRITRSSTRRGNASHSDDGSESASSSSSSSRSRSDSRNRLIESDEEEVVLMRCMRARSVSASSSD